MHGLYGLALSVHETSAQIDFAAAGVGESLFLFVFHVYWSGMELR